MSDSRVCTYVNYATPLYIINYRLERRWITLFIETDIAENADINFKLVTGVTYDISKKKKKKKKRKKKVKKKKKIPFWLGGQVGGQSL